MLPLFQQIVELNFKEFKTIQKLINLPQYFNVINLFLNAENTNVPQSNNSIMMILQFLLIQTLFKQVNSTNLLGLKIDLYLSWNNYVKHVLNKVNSGIYALRQRKMSYIFVMNQCLSVYIMAF